MNQIWLANNLRPYGLRPKTIWMGKQQGKGYLKTELWQTVCRYVPKSQVEALLGISLGEELPPTIKPE